MSVLSLIKSVPAATVKAVSKVTFKLAKNKPQILVGGGIIVATGAFILAIVNARKIDSAIAESNEKIDQIEQKKNDIIAATNISQEEIDRRVKELNKELAKEKGKSVLKMFMLLGVPAIAFAGSIAVIVKGHMILLGRFGQVSAGFAALQETFTRYRQMNISEHGEECDRRYMYGITGTETVTDKITDENGKEKNVKSKLPVTQEDAAASMYTFIFSEETSRKCPRDPVNSIAFVRGQEKYWNTYMGAYGKPVILAQVLDDLGIELDPDDPKNDYIYVVGWRPNGDGDNHIDFGIMRAINKKTIDMEENVLMLNFNCDGNIYHSARYDKNGKKVC